MIDVLYQGYEFLIKSTVYILVSISSVIVTLGFIVYFGKTERKTERRYRSREEALNAPGEIYQHYKGGIYRLIRKGVKDTEIEGRLGVYYQHLYPYEPGFFYRPEELFFGKLDNGQPRFRLIKT